MATDLQTMLDKINYAKQNKYITEDEANNLKNRVKNKADKKGNLSSDEKKSINKLLDDSLNKKGKIDKKDGGLDLVRLDNKNDKKPIDDKKPTSDNDGDGQWKEFIKGYDKLDNSQDKSVIKSIFKGAPEKGAIWKTMGDKKQNALINAVKDGKISKDEKSFLDKLFKNKGDGTPGGITPVDVTPVDGTPGGIVPVDVTPVDVTPVDGVDDDGEPDDEPASGGSEPTKKGGGKKIEIPKPENRADYTISEDSQERLGMPNISKKITKEINKLTLQLIGLTKEFIEGGIDYTGIDYVAENEVLGDNGEPYYPLPDYNAPGESDSGYAEERAEVIKEAIHNILKKGKRIYPDQYNYAEFLDLFELRYNGTGDPYYRFSVELVGEVDDLTVYLVEDYSNLI